jgi:IS5 family transposase
MRPKQPDQSETPELFRARLENLIDRRHPLVRLAELIDWRVFEESFGPLYKEGVGRPGLPTRLMVGLHLLKHMDGLSDEAICARYLDSPYVQLFCGEIYFRHALPLDRSSMTRWRKRIGAERMEALLVESLDAARRGGAVAQKHLRRITVDTTVQPKAVTHPTDSKLLHRGITTLVRLARRHGVTLRQSYLRVSDRAKREAARLIYSGRPHQAQPGPPVANLAGPAGARLRPQNRGQGRNHRRLRPDLAPGRPPVAPAARGSRQRQALFSARPGGRVHRQRQGPCALRVRRQGLHRHHQRRHPWWPVRPRCPRPARQPL